MNQRDNSIKMVDEEILVTMHEEKSEEQKFDKSDPHPLKKPACYFCKRRKIKCDFKIPCFQCLRRGSECSYDPPKKSKVCKLNPAQLAAKVHELTAELEHQKHMTQYWQKQFELKTLYPVIPNNRPSFCGSAAELCLNVGTAVLKVSQAFSDLMGALMPHSVASLSPSLSALFWNRLVANSPEDLVKSTQSMDSETITHLLLHCSIFALGSALIHEQQLADHFFSAANLLLSMSPIRKVRSADAELVNRVMLSFIFCMYNHMVNGSFSSISPMWRRAAELFLFNEQILTDVDRNSCDEFVCMMALLEPEEASKIDVWAKRLESATLPSSHTPIINLWKNIARFVIVLPKLAHFVPAHSQYLQQVFFKPFNMEARSNYFLIRQYWESLRFDALLEQVRDSPHRNLYGIWVYNMKGISAVNRHLTDYANVEIKQSMCMVDQLSKQISNSSQRIYITRCPEYIHYVVTKIQERTPESCALDLMLDRLEAMMIGDESLSYDSPIPYSYGNNTNDTKQTCDSYHIINTDYLSFDSSMTGDTFDDTRQISEEDGNT